MNEDSKALENEKSNRNMRIAIAAFIILAAFIACLVIFTHDFAPERSGLLGTYRCERYGYFQLSDTTLTPVLNVSTMEINEDGEIHYRYEGGTHTIYNYEVEGDTLTRFKDGVRFDELTIKDEDGRLSFSYPYDHTIAVTRLEELFGYDEAASILTSAYGDSKTAQALLAGDISTLSGTDLKGKDISDIKLKFEDIPTYDEVELITTDTGLSYKKAMELYDSKNN